jgi:hypothetical protein
MNYLEALGLVHHVVRPQTYCEIGCRLGHSLALARCASIAIDPDFEVRCELTAPTRIFKKTSDDFFAAHEISSIFGPVDFGFIDGFHNVEYALRDFINLEKSSHCGGIIAIDDVLPTDLAYASRERHTKIWTGDVYRLIPILRQFRPDLEIRVYDVELKGFALITNLDPNSDVLHGRLREIFEELEGGGWIAGSAEEIRTTLAPRPVEELAGDLMRFAQGRTALSDPAKPVAAYLELLKRSILNEIYLDDELRILYLRACLAGEDRFEFPVLHDIRTLRADDYGKLTASREIGQFFDRNIRKAGFSHSMMGRRRLDNLHECLDLVRERGLDGDVIECGVWRGGGCIFMAGYFLAHGMQGRRVFVADSFEGLPSPSHAADAKLDLSKSRFPELAVSLETVRENFNRYGLDCSNVCFLRGWFKDTLPAAPVDRIALLRLDGDLYESTMDALNALFDKVVKGGIVIVDDYGAIEACRLAIDDFFSGREETVPPLHQIDWTGVWFEKP